MKRKATRVFTVVFGEQFRHMCRALNKSLNTNYKECDFFAGYVHEPSYEKWLPMHCSQNLYKLWFWKQFLDGCEDGTRVVFTDADVLILGSLDPAFDEAGGEWDLAFTVRDAKIPFNSGLIYCNVNARTRAFFAAWYKENSELYKLGGKAWPIILEYAGLNQRAFAVCQHRVELPAENPARIDCRLHPLHCSKWNCEQTHYKDFNADTRVLHIKSELREYLLNDYPQSNTPPEALALVELCRSYGY